MNNSFLKMISPLYVSFLYEQKQINIPSEFENIAKMVFKKIGWNTKIKTYKSEFNIPDMPSNNKVMIALSGGLDSVYQACKLLDAGNIVYACYVKGLNKNSSNNELKQVKKIAKILGIKLFIIEFNSPKQCFADNPFKNQLILSLMLDKGIKFGTYKYAFGSDWTTTLADSVIGFNITDTIEVNSECSFAIKKHFKQFELLFIESNIKKSQRLEYLFKQHFDVFKEISSCVAPYRFREYWHNKNKEKFKIKLLNGRCGACFKCSMEYLLLCELNLITPNIDFYNQCWKNLAQSQTSHRPDLFAENISLKQRKENLLNYGS